jgi:DNA topoisomerase-1
VEQDPALVARSAGLRYVSDELPGIRRLRQGKSFTYVSSDRKPITDDAELGRIKAIGVPPAYEHVWICPFANGHLQATGIDARGRKQYRYHKKWREVRDETKFHRMIGFAQALPKMRASVERDLALRELPRAKVLAAVVRLLEETTIRVGNEEYAKSNDSYGLTTMLNRHAKVEGATVRFSFKGKSGIKHAIQLRDKPLAKIIRACQDIPGQELFGYLEADGMPRNVTSNDVNDYIREISGGDFTAKDFRTWVGTVQCALLLAEQEYVDSQSERKHRLNDVIKQVAARLGNTPAVARKSYIHPEIIAAYTEDGTIGQLLRGKPAKGLLSEEKFVVDFLKKRERETPPQRTIKKLKESIAAA